VGQQTALPGALHRHPGAATTTLAFVAKNSGGRGIVQQRDCRFLDHGPTRALADDFTECCWLAGNMGKFARAQLAASGRRSAIDMLPSST